MQDTLIDYVEKKAHQEPVARQQQREQGSMRVVRLLLPKDRRLECARRKQSCGREPGRHIDRWSLRVGPLGADAHRGVRARTFPNAKSIGRGAVIIGARPRAPLVVTPRGLKVAEGIGDLEIRSATGARREYCSVFGLSLKKVSRSSWIERSGGRAMIANPAQNGLYTSG
jgi:hypothetical protein